MRSREERAAAPIGKFRSGGPIKTVSVRRAGLLLLALLASPWKAFAQEPPPGVNAKPAVVSVRAEVPVAGQSMQVRVVDAEGKPLPGAKIHASIWAEEPAAQRQDHLADEKGEVTLPLPKRIGILRVWATCFGHVGMFAQWWPEKETRPRAIPAEFTIRLDRGTVIGGRVTDEAGQPVSRARVSVRLIEPEGQNPLVVPEPVPDTWLATEEKALTTDAEGRWSLNTAPAEEDGYGFEVMLEHPDYISDYAWGNHQKRQGVTTDEFRNRTAAISLPRGCRISGVVTDPEGRPVSGAIIIWGDDPYFQPGSQEVATDARGRYEFPPLPKSPLRVTVAAKGWAPDQQQPTLEGETMTCDFRLQEGRTLRLQFVDQAGTPIPEVSVGIAGWRNAKSLYNHVHPNVVTSSIPRQADTDGIYEWAWAPADEVLFDFYKTGYEPRNGIRMLPVDDSEYVIPLQTSVRRR